VKPRILIAGIGNIFFGDDGFGCEVAQQLARKPLPEEVCVIDFGIRAYDLAYKLTEDFDAVILVDAMARGDAPGTIAIVEPELSGLKDFESALPDAHSLNPVSVLKLAQSLGCLPEKLLLVACEPAVLESDGDLDLSEPVRGAVPRAIEEIQALVSDLLPEERQTNVCLVAD
jgi:hydrogenase maturation protease